MDLEKAHCVVTFNSNVAVEALLAGTPVFVGPHSAALPMGRSVTDLGDIENPAYPDGREELVRGVDLIGTPLTAFGKIAFADRNLGPECPGEPTDHGDVRGGGVFLRLVALAVAKRPAVFSRLG